MSSEMIERVARALLNAHFERGVGIHREWDSLNTFEKNMMYVSARAAINAMREPTAPMIEQFEWHKPQEAAAFYYGWMIGEALNEDHLAKSSIPA